MSATPRTDALRKTYAGISNANPSPLLDHHEALERELNGIKHLAGIKDVDAWLGINDEVKELRVEVERFKTQEVELTIQINQVLQSRDQWQAVAEQAIDAMKPMQPLDMGKAIAAYEKLKGEK